jgi:hypothetical protein
MTIFSDLAPFLTLNLDGILISDVESACNIEFKVL